jgi:hypothetical protein
LRGVCGGVRKSGGKARRTAGPVGHPLSPSPSNSRGPRPRGAAGSPQPWAPSGRALCSVPSDSVGSVGKGEPSTSRLHASLARSCLRWSVKRKPCLQLEMCGCACNCHEGEHTYNWRERQTLGTSLQREDSRS